MVAVAGAGRIVAGRPFLKRWIIGILKFQARSGGLKGQFLATVIYFSRAASA